MNLPLILKLMLNSDQGTCILRTQNSDTKIPQLQNILIFANTSNEIMNKKKYSKFTLL